jgi:hypothetical protein
MEGKQATMSWHVTVDRIADAQAGLLPPVDTQRVEQHLASCTSCADLATGLSVVAAVLSTSEPEPIPDSVSLGLTAAIARETFRRAAESERAESSTSESPESGDRAPVSIPTRQVGKPWTSPVTDWVARSSPER